MKLIRIILLFTFLLSLIPSLVHAQPQTPPAAVRLLLNNMTPEEKVGQLFFVSFNGTDTSASSQIYTLITKYHVGGVVLSAGNDNFTNQETLVQTHSLINNLQNIEWQNS